MSKVDKLITKKKKISGASAVSLERLRKTLGGLRTVVQPGPMASEGPGALGEILTCSAEMSIGAGQALGVSAIRWAILSAAGFDGSLATGNGNGNLPAELSTETSATFS